MKNETKPFNPLESRAARMGDDHARVLRTVEAVLASGVSLCDDYCDWLRMGFALASELGEQGRTPFMQLSAMSANYCGDRECNRKYDSIMRSSRQGVTIGTFFHMASEMAGISCSFANLPNCHAFAKNDKKYNSLIINDHKKMNSILQEWQIGKLAKHSTNGILGGKTEHSAVGEPFDGACRGKLPTFSDKLSSGALPPLLMPLAAQMDTAAAKDKVLLSALAVVSGLLPNYYGVYGGKTVYPPLYLIVYGSAASGKGELTSCRKIYEPVRQEVLRAYNAERDQAERDHARWEAMGSTPKGRQERGAEPKPPVYHSPVIPANSSSAAFFHELQNNGGWGLMFESECDALSTMLGSDYGDYSMQLRCAFHHEPISMNRRTDNLHIEIQEPRLAILLTGTPGQLNTLFKQVENGLGSRFCFYRLEGSPVWHDVFRQKEQTLDQVAASLGDAVFSICRELRQKEGRGVQFSLTPAQAQQFNAFFSALLEEQTGMNGEEFSSFVFRMGLSAFRIAMVLSMLRRYSEAKTGMLKELKIGGLESVAALKIDGLEDGSDGRLFPGAEQTLVCRDEDLHTALTIIDTLAAHTTDVYARLVPEDERQEAHAARRGAGDREMQLYDALPEEFRASQMDEFAKGLGVSQRGFYRLLQRLISLGLLERLAQGEYRKIGKVKD